MDPITLAIMQGASSAGNIYSGKKQAEAQKQATAAQTLANKAQMAYTMQRDYDTARAAEAAQRANYNQWRASQQTTNDQLQAREARMGALGSLLGAPARMPITTYIPAYEESPLPQQPPAVAANTLASYLYGK